MDSERRDALAERLLLACNGALDLLHVYLGDKLGLYRAMASGSPLSSSQLAYAEEAGFADVEVLPIDNDFWRFYRLVG